MITLPILVLISHLCITTSEIASSSRYASAECQKNMIKCYNATYKVRPKSSPETIVSDCILAGKTRDYK